MKDIVIKEKHIKRELLVFAACFVAMEIVNICAIIGYDGQWKEVVMSLGFVTVAAIAGYLVVAAVRLIIYGIIKLIKR